MTFAGSEFGLITVLLVALVSLAIGAGLGSTGYGGFLLPAALAGLTAMAAPTAVAHGLASTLLPAALAAGLHLRHHTGPSPWRYFGLLCLGTAPGVILARLMVDRVDQVTLRAVLGVAVIAAAVLIMVNRRARARVVEQPTRRRLHRLTPLVVVLAGTVAGAATVLAGVGGPLVTIPVLLAFGISLATALPATLLHAVVATIMALAVLVLPTGSEATVSLLDPWLLIVATVAMLAGTLAGVAIHRRVATERMVLPIAVVSAASGLWLLVTALAAT
ncbi:sulfite exporter TauE/SafE family protein [Propionibacteriaceae bacterium Y2011]|uniref:sulfite exporter TauE/SafE family protein n=1 Tax=Microlunatus sp. Y2014 TaxID=3418488 RepID=UPI003B4BBF92